MEGFILFLVVVNIIISIGVAGTLIRIINHLNGGSSGDVVMPSRENNLLDLQEKQLSYRDAFLMQQKWINENWDGVSPRQKNFDGVSRPGEE